jgi:hypothetical protein
LKTTSDGSLNENEKKLTVAIDQGQPMLHESAGGFVYDR